MAQSSYEYLQAFSSVLNHIRINYVDSVSYAVLVRAAIDGALRALDPHSYFVSRADWERMSALDRGELAITGMEIEDGDSATVVLGVSPGSPAARRGVQPGDRIVMIDDTTTRSLRSVDVRLRLAGPKGSKVRVVLERGSALEPDTLRVTLERKFLDQVFVSYSAVLDSTGYVRLTQFGEDAAKDLKKAIDRVKKRGARRVILDLRGNPGGIVNEALGVASLFLPQETVVFRTDGRKRGVDRDYVTSNDGKFRALPLVVLVDAGSASASEAVAGALQDHDRAVIVGRRSFGKALMQTLFIVNPTGDNVWLTVARIQSPSGRVIQRPYKGVGYAEYRHLAGTAEGTTAGEVFRTDSGRPVTGGGGIAPDVAVEAPPRLPVWWSVAADSGFITAVADSVALSLPADAATRSGWLADQARWRESLLPPFMDRVHDRLGLVSDPTPELERRLARELATRVVQVRWDQHAALALQLRTDPDVAAAVAAFDRIDVLLRPPAE